MICDEINLSGSKRVDVEDKMRLSVSVIVFMPVCLIMIKELREHCKSLVLSEKNHIFANHYIKLLRWHISDGTIEFWDDLASLAIPVY